MSFAIFVLRVVVGGLFVAHGTQKLYGWFDGQGPARTAAMFESLGLHPGRRHAYFAGIAEAGGGLLLMLGLITPLPAAILTAVMITAIWTVHGPKGPWITNGGYEYNLVLIAALFALTGVDSGALSIDRAVGLDMSSLAWPLLELAAGVLGAVFVVQSASPPETVSGGVAEPPRGGAAPPQGAA
jgi:putative oxidoreductase